MLDLKKFDPDIVAVYHITEETLDQVIRYVRLVQGSEAPDLKYMAHGGEIGTRLLLYRVLELRHLLRKESRLLDLDEETVRRLIRDQREILQEARARADSSLLWLLRKRWQPWGETRTVRYRVIEKHFEDEGWTRWGLLHENYSGMFPDCKVLFTSIPDDDRQVNRFFDARIRELNLGLEDGERIVAGEYEGRFRVLPEIYAVQGETPKEIHQLLWDRVFEPGLEETVAMAPTREEYTVQPAYQVIREAPPEAEES